MTETDKLVEKVVERLLSLMPIAIEKVTRRVQPERAYGRGGDNRNMPCPISGKSGVAIVHPQVYFRPRKLFIPDLLASLINIEDIKVGNISQAVAYGSLPGEFYSTPVKAFQMLMESSQRVKFINEALKKKADIDWEVVGEVGRLAEMFDAMAVVPAAIDVCQPGCSLTVKYSSKNPSDRPPDFQGVFVGEAILD